MMWAIDLNEFVGDSRWRVNHWHELRDAKGNLWFLNHVQTPEYSEKDKSKLFVLRNHKHHDKHGEIEVSHKATEKKKTKKVFILQLNPETTMDYLLMKVRVQIVISINFVFHVQSHLINER